MPGPTPDRSIARARVARRLTFALTAVALTVTFALTLTGIASTTGTVRPDGHAAALAARQAERDADAPDHRDCPREQRSRSASGRV